MCIYVYVCVWGGGGGGVSNTSLQKEPAICKESAWKVGAHL